MQSFLFPFQSLSYLLKYMFQRQVLCSCIILLLFAQPAFSDTANFLPTTDRTGEDVAANGSFSNIFPESAVVLFARNLSTDAGERRAALEFNLLSQIPTGSTIVSATFTFDPTFNTVSTPPTMLLHGYFADGVIMSEDFQVNNVIASEVIGTTAVQNIDVTSFVQSAFSGGNTFLGLMLMSQTPEAGMIIASKEATPIQPLLSVTFNPPTSTPGPVTGFATPHEHMMAEFAFGGGWLHGSHKGPESVALRPCDGGIDHAQIVFSQIPVERCPTTLTIGGTTIKLFGSDKILLRLADLYLQQITAIEPDIQRHANRTDGTPTFNGWPRWDSYGHMQFWGPWLRDAHDRGLNLIVMSATTFKFLCELLPAENRDFSCDEMISVDKQLVAAKDFVAQNSSWVEIALSPTDARRIINDGKLAMVLAIETTDLFGQEDLITALDRYYNLGVRSLQPVHQLDNRFGGVTHHNVVFFLAQFLRQCPPNSSEWCRECHTSSACDKFAEFNSFLGGAFGGNFPILGFDLDSNCNNTLGLTTEGRQLIQEMIDRKMLIDIAHLSEKAVMEVYDISKMNNYYPMYVSHGNFRSIMLPEKAEENKTTPNWIIDIVKETGGIFGLRTGPEDTKVYNNSGVDAVCGGSTRSLAQAYALGDQALKVDMALSPDMQGFAQQIRPRYGDFGACSASNLKEERLCQRRLENSLPFSGVNSDYDTKGFAHIGLYPDIVNQLQVFGVDTSNIENSAENFIRMWERTEFRTGPASFTPRLDDASVNSLIRFLGDKDSRNDVMKGAKSSCRSSFTHSERRFCTRFCRADRRICKNVCNVEKGECKDECRDNKQICRDGCISTRDSCISQCGTRACKRDCRKEKRQCTKGCRQEKRECKRVCRADKVVCKKQCKNGEEDCRVICPDPFLDCQCEVFFFRMGL